MWCANCQADVAAEVSLDNRRVHCATCGTELSALQVPPTGENTRDARELLERWSNSGMLDPFGPMPVTSTSAEKDSPVKPTAGSTVSPGKTGGSKSEPVFRIDGAHPIKRASIPTGTGSVPSPPAQPAAAAQPVPPASSLSQPHVHQTHEWLPPPHFDVQSAIGEPKARKTNLASLWGPFLAYGGVGLLTIGTCLVLWGYFGGPQYAGYAPTGWLITTAGQMLLFLGVITLVSGGMEQTSSEVARRVEAIGWHIHRIEQATRDHALKGPSTGTERFADEQTTRQTQSSKTPTR